MQCLSDTLSRSDYSGAYFFAHLCLRIVDSDPGAWKAFFQLLCPSHCPVSDIKLHFQSTIHFDRVAMRWQFRGSSDHSFLHLVIPQLMHGQRSQGERYVYASRTRSIPEKQLGFFGRTSWPAVSLEGTCAKRRPKCSYRHWGAGPRDMALGLHSQTEPFMLGRRRPCRWRHRSASRNARPTRVAVLSRAEHLFSSHASRSCNRI